MDIASIAVRRPGWGAHELIECILVYLVVFLALTFAAALSIGVQRDCHNERQYLTSDDGIYLTDDAGHLLTTGKESRRCRFVYQAFVE